MEWSYGEFEHAVGLRGEFHPHIRAYSPTPRTLLTSTQNNDQPSLAN